MRPTPRLVLASAIAAAALLAARPASAQLEPPGPGGYLALSGFFLGLTDTEFRDITAGGVERDLEADDGWGIGLMLGFRSGTGLRVEGELTYRHNDLDRFNAAAGPLALSGEVYSIALMGNAYFEPELRVPIQPYIGAGLGGAQVALDEDSLDADDDDFVLAYQAMAGLVFKFGPASGIFAGYRYFATDDPAIQGTDIEYRTHNLEVGLRFGF
jgi:opacity protein-like surface antigen